MSEYTVRKSTSMSILFQYLGSSSRYLGFVVQTKTINKTLQPYVAFLRLEKYGKGVKTFLSIFSIISWVLSVA